MTVGCLLIPRFSLIAALGDRTQILTEPAALAPEPGGDQSIGEVSGPAEAFGVRAGMSLSEALARCPRLLLVPPDPGPRRITLGAIAAQAGRDRRRGRAGPAR